MVNHEEQSPNAAAVGNVNANAYVGDDEEEQQYWCQAKKENSDLKLKMALTKVMLKTRKKPSSSSSIRSLDVDDRKKTH